MAINIVRPQNSYIVTIFIYSIVVNGSRRPETADTNVSSFSFRAEVQKLFKLLPRIVHEPLAEAMR